MLRNYFKTFENISNFIYSSPYSFFNSGQKQVKFYQDLVKHYTSPYNSFFSASKKYYDYLTKHRAKPDWGIARTMVGDKEYQVDNEVIYSNSFMELRFFNKTKVIKKINKKQSPNNLNGSSNSIKIKDEISILLIAPLSGHYATLLIKTIKVLLPYAKVYITDWRNISDVDKKEGEFGIDDYIDIIIDSIKQVPGHACHVVAVCQPAPLSIIAAAKIAAEDKLLEKKLMSLALIGGPVDPSAKATEVTKVANSFPLDWFEKHFITEVPYGHKGFGRRVYPGFLQLNAFISMNADTHLIAHIDYFSSLLENDAEEVEKHQRFYNQYLSIMDISGKFYLETIDRIFQRNLVAKNKYLYRGKKVDITKINKLRLIVIEGGKDDISAVGQCKQALKILKGIPKNHKFYHLEQEAGHYGIFAGRKFKERVAPILIEQFKIASRMDKH